MGGSIRDLIIIGGGPAGYNAAERAARAGMDVVLFEKKTLGGVCLNEGCIPSKSLLNSAKIYYQAAHGADFGVTGDVRLSHPDAMKRKERVIKTLTGGVAASLKHAGVTVIAEEASVTGYAHSNDASIEYNVSAPAGLFNARNVLICTGSEVAIPPIEGLKASLASGFAITSREALSLAGVPQSMAVVGGGVIGLEMAQYYNAAGCDVTVIEMLPTVGGPLDTDIAMGLRRALESKGIKIATDARVTRIADHRVCYTHNGADVVLECERALVCTGRRPSIGSSGVDGLSISMEHGAVKTDNHMLTSMPHLYAAGDVNGVSMLAHTAYREGEVAVNHMLGKTDLMRYDAIPAVIYTSPEAACAGYTLEGARKAGVDAVERSLPLMYSGRFVAESGGEGMMKAVADSATGRLLGLHILGTYASEIIYGAAAMVAAGMRTKDIREVVFPHPTVGEVFRELMFMF